MAFFELADGERIYYETHGSGPPLILVTGLSGIAGFWAQHVEALAEHFTLVLHDHRGTGQSSLSQIDYSVDQMADDVLQLINHLRLRPGALSPATRRAARSARCSRSIIASGSSAWF